MAFQRHSIEWTVARRCSVLGNIRLNNQARRTKKDCSNMLCVLTASAVIVLLHVFAEQVQIFL